MSSRKVKRATRELWCLASRFLEELELSLTLFREPCFLYEENVEISRDSLHKAAKDGRFLDVKRATRELCCLASPFLEELELSITLFREACFLYEENVEISRVSLHKAAKDGRFADVERILGRKPEYVKSFNKEGATALHLACRNGHLEVIKILLQTDIQLCFLEDNYGRTPLHVAAMDGSVDVVALLLDACPESVKNVTATGQTCLHTAIVKHQFKVIQYLIKWLEERPYYACQIINTRDIYGDTGLHLATSREQRQILELFLTSNTRTSHQVDVNTRNASGFTALDIVGVLPYGAKMDMEIGNPLRKAGALRTTEIVNRDSYHAQCYIGTGRCQEPSRRNTLKDIIKLKREFVSCVLLLTATMVAAITYLGAFSIPGRTSKLVVYLQNYDANGSLQLTKGDSVVTRSFLFLNSGGFVASVAMIIFLLHEFPLKPWPQITVSTLFSSYMCCIMAISPPDAWALLFLAIPFLLLAAAGKMYGFAWQRPCETSCNGDTYNV